MMGIAKKFVSFNLGPLMALGLGWVWPQTVRAVEKTVVDHHIRRGSVMQKDSCCPSQSMYHGERCLSFLIFDMPYPQRVVHRDQFTSEILLPFYTLFSSDSEEAVGTRERNAVEEVGTDKKTWIVECLDPITSKLVYMGPLKRVKSLDFYIQHSAECKGADVEHLSRNTYGHDFDAHNLNKWVEENCDSDISAHVYKLLKKQSVDLPFPLFITDKNHRCSIIAVPKKTKVYSL